jgi:hypothetical protein
VVAIAPVNKKAREKQANNRKPIFHCALTCPRLFLEITSWRSLARKSL